MNAIADERLVYVLRGKREYQLFCNAESSVCDRVFATFTLAA